jgi:head-tail adaptor
MTIRKRKIKDIGEMTEQIDILHKTLVETSTGNKETFQVVPELENIWAAVKDTSGVRTIDANGHYDNIVLRMFEIRYSSNFDDMVGSPAYYVRHRKRRYKIMNIENVNLQDRYLVLECNAMDFEVAS